MSNKSYVTYTDFGAVGDGVTDDFEAILCAHEYANENKLPVITDDGKTYYIHETRIDGEVRTVIIKTDVTWGSSKFTIDDRDMGYFDGTDRTKRPIFRIESYYEPITVDDPEVLARIGSIGEGTTKINYAPGYTALLVIFNDDHRVYHRSGASYVARGGQSSPQHEVLLVDKDGNIDESTPFMFNYEKLTRMMVIRADLEPLTVKGGIFTTRQSLLSAVVPKEDGTGVRQSGYLQRGIRVNRSNTTVIGTEHYVTDEITLKYFMENNFQGPHYEGFYNSSYANEVTFRNCIITGRVNYKYSSYEFRADHVNKIRMIGCTQSNFEMEDEEGNTVYSMSTSPYTSSIRCWGIGGTNFCKNMEYIDSKVSRFDAHQGLYNGKIINSSVNFMEIIGKGELLFENMNWCSGTSGRTHNSFAYLRGDYGSTWEGNITFKNCTFNLSPGDAQVFYHSYTNWNYGYTCCFPNLLIDNPTINGLDDGARIHIVHPTSGVVREPHLHLEKTLNVPVKNYDGTDDLENMTNTNVVVPPKFIKIINNNSGCDFYIPTVPFFDSTEKVGVIEEELD